MALKLTCFLLLLARCERSCNKHKQLPKYATISLRHSNGICLQQHCIGENTKTTKSNVLKTKKKSQIQNCITYLSGSAVTMEANCKEVFFYITTPTMVQGRIERTENRKVWFRYCKRWSSLCCYKVLKFRVVFSDDKDFTLLSVYCASHFLQPHFCAWSDLTLWSSVLLCGPAHICLTAWSKKPNTFFVLVLQLLSPRTVCVWIFFVARCGLDGQSTCLIPSSDFNG